MVHVRTFSKASRHQSTSTMPRNHTKPKIFGPHRTGQEWIAHRFHHYRIFTDGGRSIADISHTICKMENDSTGRVTRLRSHRRATTPNRRYDAVSFKAVWRVFHRAGWTSKPPLTRSLDNRFKYIRPNGNPSGEEGTDFFLGEQNLVDYYVSLGGETAFDDDGSGDVDASSKEETCGNDQIGDLPGQTKRVSGKRSNNVHENADQDITCDQHDAQMNNISRIECRTDITSPRCAVCHMECSVERTCTHCGVFMHHFCSHDVCASLGIRDENGDRVVDFGESCYCSERCYRATTNPNNVAMNLSLGNNANDAVNRFKPKQDSNINDRVSESVAHECVISQTGSVDPNPGTPTVPSKLKPKSKHSSLTLSKRKATTTNTPVMSKRPKVTTPSSTVQPTLAIEKTSKTSASRRTKKNSKTNRDGEASIRSELLRRLRVAADRFISAKVSFSPAEESWMPAKLYRDVGAAYLTGIVTRYVVCNTVSVDRVSVPTAIFQLQWTNTAFQSKDHVHMIAEDIIIRGIDQYVRMHRGQVELMESWSSLCSMIPKYSNIPALTEEYEELDEADYRELSAFRGRKELQIALSPDEVEAITSMTFASTGYLEEPIGLFTHDDGSIATKIQTNSRKYFGSSATSSFFAFLPICFWKQVVEFSNAYAIAAGDVSRQPIELDELMVFLGILWYMALVDKGEMKNYWSDNEESRIFPGAGSTNLSSVMVWNRFLYIRKNLAFRSEVTNEDIKRDPAARIRPMLTMLKTRCKRHIVVGRNVAVDEASVACRSKYARHIIVYNPRKPTGKYHFKFYMCCCSTTWLVVDFKLHCASELHDRLEGVLEASEIDRLADATKKSSEIRRHVLEVTHSLNGSRRIVNTDNFYTSCLLLESLRSVGLHGRGTVRSSSKHFPHFTMLDPKVHKNRGEMKQGVCVDKHIVAASWMDGSIVNIISNADASSTTTVQRRISNNRVGFNAPACVREYNAAMQGVDRHDQLRSRFSIADGHSFKKWHKKVAMAIVDIARCNAYICHELVAGGSENASRNNCSLESDNNLSRGRDQHRAFVAELVREMFDGSWKKCLLPEEGIAYVGESFTPAQMNPSGYVDDETNVTEQSTPLCVAKDSSIFLKGRSRSKRECTVCRFEGRQPTQKTDFCEIHHVALCKRQYPIDSLKPHLCQEDAWTCWQKYHRYYLPRGVYTLGGNLMRTSTIYKIQAPFIRRRNKEHSESLVTVVSLPEGMGSSGSQSVSSELHDSTAI